MKRTAVADAPVIGPGCNLIGLLDPDHGLDPKEISSLASAYDCTSTIFKKTSPSETLEEVGDTFLQSVAAAVESQNIPTTIIVLGHGLPKEIQSYHIPVDRLAKTLLTAAAHANDSSSIDLGHLTVICDDCYSADFMINPCHDNNRLLPRTVPSFETITDTHCWHKSRLRWSCRCWTKIRATLLARCY